MENRKTILLIGAGKMGGALLSGWLHKRAVDFSVTVLEKDAGHAAKLPEGATIVSSLKEVSAVPDCIVLAVKPQSMDALLPELATYFHSPRLRGETEGRLYTAALHLTSPASGGVKANTPLYLSIAAGKTLAYFEKHLGAVPVVRAMPNTPALVRKGITALIANANTNTAQKQLAENLLGAVGEILWLDDESQMDAVTAVSGSGPAYVFLFLEALIAAGVKQGLPEEIAHKLALATVRGSVKLAMKSDESLEQLRKNVTSPGGTTEAALKILMNGQGFGALLDAAVEAAVKRGKELGNA